MARPGAIALAFGFAVAVTGCPPNEAKVCGSKSESAGASCTATYDLCSGVTDRLECAPGTANGVTCTCLENGSKKRTFQSDDACNVTPDTLKKRAAAGCGWDILDDE